MFADDTCVYMSYDNRMEGITRLNEDLESIMLWSKRWLVDFNPSKTDNMLITTKRKQSPCPPVIMGGTVINEVKNHKHLGMILSNSLTWSKHIDEICIKSKKRLDVMKSLTYKINRKSLELYYFSFIAPMLEYGIVKFVGGSKQDLNKIYFIEKEAMRVVTGATARCNSQLLKIETKWEDIETGRKNHTLVMLFKIMNCECPLSLKHRFENFIIINLTLQKI